MIEIFTTDEFDKRFRALPEQIQKKAYKQEKLFRANPFYPSLHTEKLEPKGKQVWSFRIDRSYRILFTTRHSMLSARLPMNGYMSLRFTGMILKSGLTL